MSRKYLLWILLNLLLLASAILLFAFRKSPDTVMKEKAAVRISANQLAEAYEADEHTSDSLYLNKVIIVEGLIADIQKEASGRITVNLKGSYMGNVACLMGKNEAIPRELTEGDKTTIKGRCNGYTLDVILNKCSIVK